MPATDNQPEPLSSYNLFTADPVLSEAVHREGGDLDVLESFGAQVGNEQTREWGRLANKNVPILHTHDASGNRIDEIEYHPAYHSLLNLAVESGIHCMRYEKPAGDGAYVTRNALMGLITQIEMGHGCPTSMTSGALMALRHQPELAELWEPLTISRSYDQQLKAPKTKSGVLLGMGMTERQGGSDVRANTSTATPSAGGGPGAEYQLEGHKWFTSAPMCDAFLVLAYAPKGMSCFLVPRVLPDGTRNSLRFMRLKDKLGNRSNASAELEFDCTTAWMVGEEGRGIPTIIEMVHATRLDVANWGVSLMRQAVSQAGWHVANREAFGATLIDKPLMQNVLADLEIEVEAATLMITRLSGAHERMEVDEREQAFARLATPVAKYWLTKQSNPVVREALECVGGNGYVEDSMMPRLYREAPLNAIWEGAGNVIALDIGRAASRNPESVDIFLDELEQSRGRDAGVDEHLDALRAEFANPLSEAEARRLVEKLAVTWAATLMVEYGHPSVSEAYLMSRVGGDHGSLFGTLPKSCDLDQISRRAVPA
ncbi:MAG: DNA alkylation response protein [Acidimicrobiales bacterium MED-G01]|nr:MAG: DNA alkylation response protein [Acidimicrobiales bacterium MED-G01]